MNQELYTSPYFVLVYPSKNVATTSAALAVVADRARAAVAAHIASADAAFWSEYFKEPVYSTEPDEFLLFLEHEDSFAKVISEKGVVGWIWVLDWMKLKKVDAYED